MESLEYSYVRREVLKLTGVDLNGYKGAQMQRRLDAYLQRTGQHSWVRLFQLLRRDSTQLAHFRAYLTINVSAFMRDPEKYDYLREHILPMLLHARRRLRVWSAGCSHGQEAYSLAMLLAEGGVTGHRLLATDLDEGALAIAMAGGPYSAADIAHLSAGQVVRYLEQRDEKYWVQPTLRRSVQFSTHNLLADPFESNFDLIVCRNVVIYFTAEKKAQLYAHFAEALRPGGVLFVGATEVVPKAISLALEPLGLSFYQRRL
ncbi:MAG: protein-glutamate O-methyltransferase CheR [Ardenticatenales bacterium]|nr:protein-glutamate O-methyltransferase CheR [Ardenticatenales bacterium]